MPRGSNIHLRGAWLNVVSLFFVWEPRQDPYYWPHKIGATEERRERQAYWWRTGVATHCLRERRCPAGPKVQEVTETLKVHRKRLSQTSPRGSIPLGSVWHYFIKGSQPLVKCTYGDMYCNLFTSNMEQVLATQELDDKELNNSQLGNTQMSRHICLCFSISCFL